jgi:DNA-binding response OmpR family regulator
MRMLIIEDEKQLSSMLKATFVKNGIIVDEVQTSEDGEYLAVTTPYDVIIVDIRLTDKDGSSVCRSLRNQNINVPILLLTEKCENSILVHGLNSGADDYIVKPVIDDILIAKINALIRRSRNLLSPQIKLNNLEMDTISQRVWRGQEEIHLTPKEYAILEYLVGHSNQVVNKNVIEQHIWNTDIGSNTLDVHIKNLRIKLGNENRSLIQTLRGKGYRLESRPVLIN